MRLSRLWICPALIIVFTLLALAGSLLAHVKLSDPVPLDTADQVRPPFVVAIMVPP